MSVGYRAVGWSRQKKIYDTALAGGVGLFLRLHHVPVARLPISAGDGRLARAVHRESADV